MNNKKVVIHKKPLVYKEKYFMQATKNISKTLQYINNTNRLSKTKMRELLNVIWNNVIKASNIQHEDEIA